MSNFRTVWQQREIVVFGDDHEVGRVDADRIERVWLVHTGDGDTPGEIRACVVEQAGDAGYALFDASTGFAGRVNFERQVFWRERRCVYWIAASRATLPWRLRARRLLGGVATAYCVVPRSTLEAHVLRWRAEGPETWDERKQRRIEMRRPFAPPAARA